jgi:nucleotide-binding universal stress UspA family protein
LLIHQPAVGTIQGQVSDLEIQEAEISRLRRVLESMFAALAGQTEARIRGATRCPSTTDAAERRKTVRQAFEAPRCRVLRCVSRPVRGTRICGRVHAGRRGGSDFDRAGGFEMTRGFELGSDGPNVIVVGVDGSPTSMRAGAYAAGLARRQNSRIVAVHVTSTPMFSGMVPSASGAIEQGLEDVAEEVRREVEAAVEYMQMSADYRAVRGDPFTELARIADEVRADAVVVGASTQAGHRLIGSLAVRLVRAGRWPVTVVP